MTKLIVMTKNLSLRALLARGSPATRTKNNRYLFNTLTEQLAYVGFLFSQSQCIQNTFCHLMNWRNNIYSAARNRLFWHAKHYAARFILGESFAA